MAEAKICNPFMYPFSKHGIIQMVILVAVLLVGCVLQLFSSSMFTTSHASSGRRALPYLVVIPFGYFFMYLNECMIHSSNGGITAPSTMPGRGGIEDLAEEFGWGITPLLLCFLPSFFYMKYVDDPQKMVFFTIIVVAVFLYPMLSLRSSMLRSPIAYNPFGIIINIIRFFPGYLLLLAGMLLLILPIMAIIRLADGMSPILLIILPWFIYGSLVLSHLIGRFYFHRKDKLNWEY